MSRKEFAITEAEWEVMKVIWSNDYVTSREVIEILNHKTNWSVSTVKTLLARLVDKTYLSTEKNGKQFIYRATVNEEEAINNLLAIDIEKICQKKKGKMIYQLIKEQELSQQDIKDLQELLNEKIKTAPLDLACNCAVGQCNCHK